MNINEVDIPPWVDAGAAHIDPTLDVGDAKLIARGPKDFNFE